MVKIGQTFYLIYRGGVYKQKVYMLGKESFIHGDTFNYLLEDDYKDEIFYEAKGETWFETLEQVKQKYKIKKIENGYWEIETSEDIKKRRLFLGL